MAAHRNQVPQLIAGGNIYPSRFIKVSTAADNTALQAGANEAVCGISQSGSKYPSTEPSGLLGTDQIAAVSGDNIGNFGLGDVCPVVCGGTVTAGDLLESDSNGKAVTSGPGRNFGARALESGTPGQLIRCQIIIGVASGGDAAILTATRTVLASESGKTFFLNSATEFVTTLPAPALGLKFVFVVSAAPSGASYTVVTASSANIILGHVVSSQDAGGSGDSETSGGDTVSFVDGKAVVGDRAEFVSDGTSWFVRASCKVFDAITITTAS